MFNQQDNPDEKFQEAILIKICLFKNPESHLGGYDLISSLTG